MYGDFSSETWDFVRCVRADGTAYGTSGKCRKGAEQEKQYPYKAAVTQGRFNIPHKGHAKLIKHLLEKAPIAYVVMGGGDKNVDKDFRSQMLRAILRKEGVDLSRVKLLKGDKASSVINNLKEIEGAKNVVFMLGEDQTKFLDSMKKSLGMDTAVVPRESSGASSSAIRKMIDSGDLKSVRKEFDGDDYLSRLALLARRVEKNEFAETFDFVRCQRADGSFYGTKGKCRKGVEAGNKEKGSSLFSQGKDVDVRAVEKKAEEWRKEAGLKAESGSVDWKHDRVHVLVHEFVGGKESIAKWLGSDSKSPTPAEETLVNMVHRAAALKGRGDDVDFTDRDLTRYFSRDLQVCWGRGQIPDKEYSLYFTKDKDGFEVPDVKKFVAKYREMESKPGFDKLLEASHAMWTEAGDYML